MKGEGARRQMYDDEPRAKEVDHLMKEVCIRDAVQGRVHSQYEEHNVGDVAYAEKDQYDDTVLVLKRAYRVWTRGIIRPVLRVSTRKM
jgi:hypothetical protein